MPSLPELRQRAEDLYHEGLELLANGEPAAAALKLCEALEVDSDFLDAMHGLTRVLQDLGEYDEAIRIARQLIAADPEDTLAHTSLSILYQHKGMVPEAEAEALKAKLLGWKLQLRESRNLHAGE